MKKYGIIALCTLSFGFITAADTIKIIAYNALPLLNSPKEAYHYTRRESFFSIISAEKPSIIGFRGIPEKSGFLAKEQGTTLGYQYFGDTFGYQFFGDARNTTVNSWYQKKMSERENVRNKRNPIVYDTEKLNLIASGNFGINPIGRFFTASLPRICTWGLFEDKTTKKQFYVYNTELSSIDWWGLTDGTELIRHKQIHMILDHIAKNSHNIPVIIMGDINTTIQQKTNDSFEKALFKDAQKKTPSVENLLCNNSSHMWVKNADVIEYKIVEIIKHTGDPCAVIAEISLQ